MTGLVALGVAAVLVGASLVSVGDGPAATAYVVGVGASAALLALRAVQSRLPPAAAPARPLLRLVPRRPAEPAPSRPAALAEWEAALIGARLDGWAARTFGARLAPIVTTHLAERRAVEADDQRAVELLGPTWARIRPEATHGGAGTPGASLDEIDDLVHRLERL